MYNIFVLKKFYYTKEVHVIMAKRKKDNTKRNWEDLEWEVGSIYATNVETGVQTYFVALKGNPLVIRTMVEGDLDAVFEKYKQSLNTKIIKETRKECC